MFLWYYMYLRYSTTGCEKKLYQNLVFGWLRISSESELKVSKWILTSSTLRGTSVPVSFSPLVSLVCSVVKVTDTTWFVTRYRVGVRHVWGRTGLTKNLELEEANKGLFNFYHRKFLPDLDITTHVVLKKLFFLFRNSEEFRENLDEFLRYYIHSNNNNNIINNSNR